MKWIDGNGDPVAVVSADISTVNFLDAAGIIWTYDRTAVPTVKATYGEAYLPPRTGAHGVMVYFASLDCTGVAYAEDGLQIDGTFYLSSADAAVYVRPLALVTETIVAASYLQQGLGTCAVLNTPTSVAVVPVASLTKPAVVPVVVGPIHAVRAL